MSREELRIDPDIRRARTPPGWLYTDADVFARQRDRVFARAWHFVADQDAARAPGAFHPFVLQPGVLAEPLVLTRGADGRLHGLSNVCTHRGTLVCEKPGSAKTLRCPYHGRRFALDGRFLSMPGFDDVADFPSAADDLRPVPLATWRTLHFASLAPAHDFSELVGDMDGRCGALPLDRAVPSPDRSRDYEVRANWALYCENYLEGFHIRFVHPELARTLDTGAYRTELFARSSVQVGIAGDGEEAFAPPPGHPDHGQRVGGYYWWLWPCTMLNFYPWGLSLNVVEPLAPDRTRVRFLAYVWDESKLDRGAGAGLDRVEIQDEAVVERVQRGAAASLRGCGRYAPSHEAGVHHFHRLLASAMSEAGSDG